jgi:glycosyltransferase involved in cell wall biosynthesis
MRILFVLDGLFMGGAERNTLDLMRELADNGHEAHLCTLGAPAGGFLFDLARSNGIRVHTLNVKRIYDPRAAFRFILLVKTVRPDCIHVEDPYGHIIAAAARNVCKVPAVMTRHVNAGAGQTRWERLRSYVLQWAARHAYDRAILVADALRPLFQEQYGFPQEKTVTIHNGVVIGMCRRKERAALLDRLNWPKDAPIILMVAVLRPGKGHDTMLRALPAIAGKLPKVRLYFAGAGPLGPQIESDAAAFASQVVLLGERQDVADLMSAASVVVLPSESEALPTVLLEAAAAGCPVVASAVGGVGEIVDDGVTGLLVPPRDEKALAAALVRILSDPELGERMGRAARAKAESQFSIAIQAKRTLEVYRHLLGGLPGHANFC